MKTLTPDQIQSLKVNDQLVILLLAKIDISDHALQHESSKALYLLSEANGSFSQATIASEDYKTKVAKRQFWELYVKFCNDYRSILDNKQDKQNMAIRGKLAVSLAQFNYENEVENLELDHLAEFVAKANYTYQKTDDNGDPMVDEEDEPIMVSENILERIIRQSFFDWKLQQSGALPTPTFEPAQ